MNESEYDTMPIKRRKRIKKISLLATNGSGTVMWRPHLNEKFILTEAYLSMRQTTGTNISDAPNIKLNNGTTDTVADVSAVTTTGVVQRLSVVGNVYFDNEHPLTLVITDAPAGADIFDVDLILVATALHALS